MFLNGGDMITLLYSFLFWLLPNLMLLALIYLIVRIAVRQEISRDRRDRDGFRS